MMHDHVARVAGREQYFQMWMELDGLLRQLLAIHRLRATPRR